MPFRPLAVRGLLLVLAALLSVACSVDEAPRIAAPDSPSPTAVPGPASSSPAPGPAEPEEGRPAAAPGTLPPGPATPSLPTVEAPGSLATSDWRAVAQRTCEGGRPGAVTSGDLDGDAVAEAVVPVTCPGPPRGATRVLVLTGTAAAPRVLGDALPPEEQAELQAAQLRGADVVVGALRGSAEDPAGPATTLVTSRWRLQGGALVRVDRWEDPAQVVEDGG